MVIVGRLVIVIKVHNPSLVNPNLQILELYTGKERKKERKKRERQPSL